MPKLLFFTLSILLLTDSFAQDNCLSFNGSSDYLLIGDVNDLDTSDFTIEAWVYAATDAGVGQKIIAKGVSSVGTPANAGYGLRIFDNTVGDLDFHVGDASGAVTTLSYNGLSPNTWYHVAGTRRGQILNFYVNGQLVDSYTTPFVYNVNSNLPLCIGAIDKLNLSPTNEFMNGMIDEVRIWNVARDQQVIDLYKDCAITSPEPNLLAVYNLNENSGTNAADSSGNGNDAVFVSNPQWVSSSVAPICTISVDEKANTLSNLLVYPNPASQQLHLQFTTEQIMAYTICDPSGRGVLSGTVQNKVIDISTLESGPYFLMLQHLDGVKSISFYID